jgi:fumarate hydratase class II
MNSGVYPLFFIRRGKACKKGGHTKAGNKYPVFSTGVGTCANPNANFVMNAIAAVEIGQTLR